MSATELVSEKIKSLSEPEALAVLDFLNQLPPRTRAPKASELLCMPAAERERILAAQAASAERLYRENPEMIVEDWDEPLDYA